MNGTKPYTSNGTTKDPREEVMWSFYVSELTNGIDNAYQAAIKAGYSESSAKNVTLRDWFKEKLGKLKRKDILSKAEKVLDRTLGYEPVDEEGKIDSTLLRVQTDVAKHVTSTLGKNDGYSTRNELTDGEGKPLQVIVPQAVADRFKINGTDSNTTEDDQEPS